MFIDIFEVLPVPYGLLRYGVAPDHQEMKNPMEQFDELFEANKERLRFFGNVDFRLILSKSNLINEYSHVILVFLLISFRVESPPLNFENLRIAFFFAHF